MAYPSVSAGDEILEAHYNAIVGSLTGQSGKGQQILLTDYASTTNYSFTAKNATTNGLAARFQASNGNDIGLFNDAATTLKSKDGTRSVVVSDSSVAVTAPSGTFTVNGQTVGAGYRVYNVLDHGIVTGSTSTNAAANTTALQTLWATLVGLGSGVIYFPPGTYPFNATSLTTATPGAIGVSVSIEGGGKNATVLEFYGSTGPFLEFAPTSGSLQRWHIKNLLIQHDSVSTGACLRFSGAISKVALTDVEIGAGGFLIGIQTAHATEMILDRCKINTRTDYSTMVSGALTPIALDVNNSSTLGGLYLHHTELGCVGKGSNPAAYGTILRLNNSGAVDTIVLGDGTHLIGGAVGILKNSGAGNVSNVLIGKAYITDTEVCEQIEPPSGSSVENWIHTGTWLDGRHTNVLVTKSNTGTPAQFTYTGCYLTNAEQWGMFFGPGVNVISLTGNEVMTSINTSGRSGIEIGDGSTASESVSLVGGIVSVGSSADASYKIGAAVDAVTVAHVTQRGVAGQFNGSTSTSRVHVAGAFKA